MTEREVLVDGTYVKRLYEPESLTAPDGAMSYQVAFDTTFWPDGVLVPVKTWFSIDDGATWQLGGSGVLGKAGLNARVLNTAFLGCTFNKRAPPNIQIKISFDLPLKLRTSCKLRTD